MTELRPELSPRKVGARDEVALREVLLTLRNAQTPAELEAPLEQFHSLTGAKEYDAAFFLDADWGMSFEDFCELITMEPPPRVPDIRRDELVEITRRIIGLDRPYPNEADQHWYIGLLQRNVPHPAASDLIFWPPEHLDGASIETLVDTMLSLAPETR